MSDCVTCDQCGASVVRKHLARHKEGGRCKSRPPGVHCNFCWRPAMSAMFDLLKAGDSVDAVARKLNVSVRYVQDTRTRGRSLGCLPKSTQEERAAEMLALARERFGEKSCEVCGATYVPRLNTPDQVTCNKRCQEKRKERKRREALGLPVRPLPGRSTPEKQEEEMRPLRMTEEELARQVELTGAAIEAGRAASYALWGECLGVAL